MRYDWLTEPAKKKSGRMVIYICGRCGSYDVEAEALALWDVETQSWKLESVISNEGWCDECYDNIHIVKKEI